MSDIPDAADPATGRIQIVRGPENQVLALTRRDDGLVTFELSRVHPHDPDCQDEDEIAHYEAYGDFVEVIATSGLHEDLESALREARPIAPWIDRAELER